MQLLSVPAAASCPPAPCSSRCSAAPRHCRYRTPESSGAAVTASLVEAGLAANPGAHVLTLGDHTYPVGMAA